MSIGTFKHVRVLDVNTYVTDLCNTFVFMNTLAIRLTWARTQKGLSQAELAKKSGVSQSTIGNLEAGIRLTARNITAIATALDVNPVWLAEGKGSPTNEAPDNLGLSQKNIEISSIGEKRIPLISYVQAGCMSEIVNPYQLGDASEFLLTDLDLGPNAFALQIKGDSMLPDFKEGDRIIIDPAVQPLPGDFVVAKNGHEEATFKKYRPRGLSESGDEIFELVPLNEDYPSMRSDTTPLRIIGTMIEHRRYRKR